MPSNSRPKQKPLKVKEIIQHKILADEKRPSLSSFLNANNQDIINVGTLHAKEVVAESICKEVDIKIKVAKDELEMALEEIKDMVQGLSSRKLTSDDLDGLEALILGIVSSKIESSNFAKENHSHSVEKITGLKKAIKDVMLEEPIAMAGHSHADIENDIKRIDKELRNKLGRGEISDNSGTIYEIGNQMEEMQKLIDGYVGLPEQLADLHASVETLRQRTVEVMVSVKETEKIIVPIKADNLTIKSIEATDEAKVEVHADDGHKIKPGDKATGGQVLNVSVNTSCLVHLVFSNED